MAMLGGLRSMSGRTAVLVALAAAYYIALNVVLINELVERVRMGPQFLPATQSPGSAALPDAQASSTACADLAGIDREICKLESRIGRASGASREERRERRAAREERRAGSGPAQLERAAALR